MLVVLSILENELLESLVPESSVVQEVCARFSLITTFGKLASGELGVAGVEAELDGRITRAELVVINNPIARV